MADRIVQVNLTVSNSQNPFSPHLCLLPQAGHGILWLESSILSFSVAEYPDVLVIGVGMWTSGIFVASLLLADWFCVGMFFSSCQALSESKGPEDFLPFSGKIQLLLQWDRLVGNTDNFCSGHCNHISLVKLFMVGVLGQELSPLLQQILTYL